jgi:signal transduction histidine kinase
MFSSLRARLWLSYALLVLAALFLTAVILVLYLLRSPVVYRQVYARLEAIQGVLLTTNPDLTDLPSVQSKSILQSSDKTFNVRILIYNSDRTLVIDSRADTNVPMASIRRIAWTRNNLALRDVNGKIWLYYLSRQADGKYLLLGVPRPRLALLTIVKNEIFPPFLVAGLAALLLSLLVAYGLARWIGNPLQMLVTASRRMPHADAHSVPLHGPREVQTLTRAFNAMTARVQASQQSQREFVANVSHELKTPLTSIQGFAQALQDGTADTDASRQHAVAVIQEETGRMHRMVVDLLDLARLDAGTLVLQHVAVDLPALLKNVAEKFIPQANATGVKICVEAAGLPTITGDADRLAQVFTNLVDNALKSTPAGGSITLQGTTGTSPGLVVQVEVSDNGTGIPSEALAHIFDRFYQADPSRPGGRKHGAGLGLAIVREIVTAHGGTISVRSGLGTGSTFTVTLPLTMPEATAMLSRNKR